MKLTNRMGNKKRLLQKLKENFPDNIKFFVDLFFGSGTVTYDMCLKYPNLEVVANDMDNNISNLFYVVRNNLEEFVKEIKLTPYHQTIFKDYFLKKEFKSDIEKAVVFWYTSNYNLYGGNYNMKIGSQYNFHEYINDVEDFFKIIHRIQFISKDFREALNQISVRRITPFVYADPPYIGTEQYKGLKWKEQDAIDLVEVLIGSGYQFMISEFDNDLYRELAKKHNLNYIYLQDRTDGMLIRSGKTKTEIVITNYKKHPSLF